MSLRNTKSAVGSVLHDSLVTLRWWPYRLTGPRIRAGLRNMPLDDLIYSVKISRRHHYVYIDNPKTGCSSLKSALVQLEGSNQPNRLDHYNWQVFHDPSVSPLLRLNDLRYPTSLSKLTEEGYRFVTFVRNPYTRLLSCYRDKILGKKRQKLEIMQSLGLSDRSINTPISFAEFVTTVASQADRDMNPHWRVQSSQILYGIVDYSFIGRFERYNEDFRECFNRLGIPKDDIPEARHLNRSKTGSSEHCDQYFTKELQSMVYERYMQDFENFVYSYELPP